jgi:hypothetical protein
MAASYPTSTKSFSTHSAGQTIASADVNAIQDEVVAVENGLRTGLQHNLIFTDATYDIGASGATRPRDFYLSRNATIGGTLGVTGIVSPLALVDISGASAGQVKFPASQNASSNANTLDDYEEGTWVPTWTNGSIGNGAVGAAYVKVGQLITCWITLTMGTTSTFGGGGAWTFSLPLAAGNVNVNFYGVAQALDSSANTLYVAIASIAASGTTLTLNVGGVGTFFTSAVPFTWATSDTLNICVSYRAAA